MVKRLARTTCSPGVRTSSLASSSPPSLFLEEDCFWLLLVSPPLLKARSEPVDQLAGVGRHTCRLLVTRRPRWRRGVWRTSRAEEVAARAAARLVEKDRDDDEEDCSLGTHKRLCRARLRSKERNMLFMEGQEECKRPKQQQHNNNNNNNNNNSSSPRLLHQIDGQRRSSFDLTILSSRV
jgi:hypothetical protein